MLKQQYMDYFNLSSTFTTNELQESFKQTMSEIRNSNIYPEQKIEKASMYNDAINYLRQYTKSEVVNKQNVFSNKKCNMFGMTYEEVSKMLDKHNTNYDMVKMIDNITYRFNEKIVNKRFIFPLTMVSEELWSFPIDRLVSMYLLDETNNVGFASYIITLSNICNSYTKLDDDFSLEKEYTNFINSKEKNFLVYLSQQVEIKYICVALGEKEYLLRHRFEYESTNFKGSFIEYLQSLIDIKSMTDTLSLNNDELTECYNEYINLGYNESIYIFLKDFYDVKDYCNSLIHVYLSLKKRYMRMPRNQRLQSFKNWVQLNKAEGTLELTADQILEHLYMSAKEDGYEGQIDDYINELVNTKSKKLSLR